MRLKRWMLSCNLFPGGFSTEKEHLKQLGDNESSQRDFQILHLAQSGKSVREIASQSELWQINRQPDNPAQQNGSHTDGPSVPPSRPIGKRDNGTTNEARQTELFAGQRKQGGQGMNKVACTYLFKEK